MTEKECHAPTKDTQTTMRGERGRAPALRGASPEGERSETPARRARRGSPLAELPPEVRERLSDELIDELLAGARSEEEIVGPGGLLADLTAPAGGARDGGRADRAPGL